MKNIDAPLAWIRRNIHPLLTFRIICSTLWKAVEVSEVKCIARNRPVMIWMPKHKPSKDPKFHQLLIFNGVGRSTKDLLIILINGSFFRVFIIVEK